MITIAVDMPAVPNTVAIAHADQALTFARIESGAKRRVLLVLSYENGSIEAVDLSAVLGVEVEDPISVYRERGYAALRDVALQTPESARVTVAAQDLTIPVDLGSHHVAAGTNYPEHAGEAGVEDGPFLFAKLVPPTGPRATVPVGAALLDYEVELAWVALDPISEGTAPSEMGLILCNDYTDRQSLLRHVDAWDIASGKGFTTGKSFPGFLPVGDLFVIPRDHRAFAAARELRLYVNGELRQHSLVSAQVWDIDELLGQTWARRDRLWEHEGRQVSLFANGRTIEARALIMSGTPAGTIFRNIGLAHRLRGLAHWALGGFRQPLTQQVIESYLRDPHTRSRYLQPGDRVTIDVDYLGVIDNEIVP